MNLAQWRSFTGLLFTKTKSAAIFPSFLRYCVLRVKGFLRILILLLGSAVLLHWVVTHLLGIFKGIIPYYTVYIAIPFSLEVTCSLIYVTAVLWPGKIDRRLRRMVSQNGGKFERFLISFSNRVLGKSQFFFSRNVYEICVDSDD